MGSPNFVLIGAAGYVAPRHMAAIRAVGGKLVAAIDPHDSVGILDSYFPECTFFTEFERLDRHVHKMLARNERIDYVSICSPNYLHDAHCRWAMRIGADAICEKPLVLNERNLDALLWEEERTGRRTWNILQLRIHPSIFGKPLPKKIRNITELSVVYHTPRGRWYDASWKSEISKSGGLATNIGVHLFDLASHLYGKSTNVILSENTQRKACGTVLFREAIMFWSLGIDQDLKPTRVFTINDVPYDFTSGFSDLHKDIYHGILEGNGFGLQDARESIRICERIRNT